MRRSGKKSQSTLMYPSMLALASVVLLVHGSWAAPILPDTSGTLVLNLDARFGVTASGGNVSAWDDLSGAGRNALTLTGQPQLFDTVLGQRVIRFDGDDSLSLTGQVLNSQQFSVFAVANDQGSGLREIISNWNATAGNFGTSFFFGTSGSAGSRVVRLSDGFAGGGTLSNPGDYSTISGISSATNAINYQNGVPIAALESALTPRNFTTPWVIGRQGELAGEYWVGDIASVLVYEGALTETDRTAVESYLATEFSGLLANNPPEIILADAPAGVQGVRLWLDGNDTDGDRTADISGGTLSTWVDKSGTGNAIGPNAPTQVIGGLNGKGVVSFQGGQNLANTGSLIASGNSDRTVIYLADSFDSAQGDIAVGLSGTAGAGNAFGITDTTLYGITGPFDTTGLSSFGNVGANQKQIMAVVYKDGKIDRWTNGSQVSNDVQGKDLQTQNGYVIGNWANFDRPFNGEIAEVLVYDKALSDGSVSPLDNELNDINFYLQEKFGLNLGLQETPTTLPPPPSVPPTFGGGPNLIVNLDARTGVVADGGNLVSGWSNAAGGDVSAAGSQRPVLVENVDILGDGTVLRPAIRFDGVDDVLRNLAFSTDTPNDLTVFVVAAPNSNEGGFRGFITFNDAGGNDFATGLHLDLGGAPTDNFDVLNMEGSKRNSGEQDLKASSGPFGKAHVITAVFSDESGGQMFVDSVLEGTRSDGLNGNDVNIDELRIGSRFFFSERGYLDGDIMAVLVYDGNLGAADRLLVESYLQQQFFTVPEPSTLMLLGMGLVGFSGGRRRSRRRVVSE